MTTTQPTAPAAVLPRRATHVAAGVALLATFGLIFTMWGTPGPAAGSITAVEARSVLGETLAMRDLAMHGTAAALVAFTVALAALWTLARRSLGDGVLPAVLLLGGTMVLLDWWMFGAVTGIPVVVEDLAGVTPEVARGWYALGALQEAFGDIGKAGQTLFLAGVGWTGLTGRFLHRPVAWAALALVPMNLLSLALHAAHLEAASTAFFLAGLYGFTLWVPAAGISVLLRSRAARTGGMG
ncbi:hypothetical protein [Georgenia yuyongxinii]|uniref:DUF4386 family protein n=1 Tax=Georgenia yuyongxinii TaxID=2589797 RepID=A0A552WNZ4_9MICO|nr:hypothetical protein [Georgenia yuyongxinii]TRW44508.1 hypothetical protein FJ693_13300 [Georgenia yuyongxinii]